MLYIYLGTEEKKLREKVHVVLESLQKKRPEAELFSITEENFSLEHVEELAASGGLFDPKHIVFFDHVLGDGCMEEGDAKRILPLFKTSESIFVMLETALPASLKKICTKYAEQIIEQDRIERKKTEFNIFALGDALVSRDKIKLWSLYLEALLLGKNPEEIHGTLLWQAKSMAQAHRAKSAHDSGLKPFVYNKSKQAEKKYSNADIEQMPWNLVSMLHRSRLESEDLSVSLERWILTI